MNNYTSQTTSNCSCNPCHATNCGCGQTGTTTSQPDACCCGSACGCGAQCECPTSCGCAK